jgi:hypothetical protein
VLLEHRAHEPAQERLVLDEELRLPGHRVTVPAGPDVGSAKKSGHMVTIPAK